MKKFVFTLERLKKYREQILETEKGTLSALRGQLAELTREAEELLALIELKNKELTELLAKGTNPVEISTRKRYISSKQQELAQTRQKIALKEQEIEKQMGVVVVATQEVSKMEKLEEHQLEAYNAEAQKENELFIEEFVSNDDWRKNNAQG